MPALPSARDLFGRHLDLRPLRGRAVGTVRCIFHGRDRHASLSVDLVRGLFHCFACGEGGGLRRFAELVHEPIGEPMLPVAREPARGTPAPPVDEHVPAALIRGALARELREDQHRSREAARQTWAEIGQAEIAAGADWVRLTQRHIDRTRAVVTRLGPRHRRTWELLEWAAHAETMVRTVEVGLDDLAQIIHEGV